MALTKKQGTQESEYSKDSYVSLGKNETAKIIPLCDFEGDDGIDSYYEYSFSTGATFFTIPDTGEKDSPGKMLNAKSAMRWIMPVIVWDAQTKTWSEPKYYKFKPQIMKSLTAINEDLKTVEPGEDARTFKGSIITISRNDAPGVMTSYSAAYASSQKSKPVELPENNLDMAQGVYAHKDEKDLRDKIIKKLIERGTTSFTDRDGIETTILERMKEVGLLNSTEDEWAEFEVEENEAPF